MFLMFMSGFMLLSIFKKGFFGEKEIIFFPLKIENENIFIFSTDFKELTYSIMFEVAHCNNFHSFLLLLYINKDVNFTSLHQ